MKRRMDDNDALQRNWTRREVLGAGSLALLGLAGRGSQHMLRLRQNLAHARQAADFVVTFVHCGIKYFPGLTAHQRHLAQVAIDAGADLVVGAQPHVIEPYEFYQGKLIIYSLGNFVFDNMDEEVVRRGTILTLTVQKNQLLAWKLVSTRIGEWGEPHLLPA